MAYRDTLCSTAGRFRLTQAQINVLVSEIPGFRGLQTWITDMRDPLRDSSLNNSFPQSLPLLRSGPIYRNILKKFRPRGLKPDTLIARSSIPDQQSRNQRPGESFHICRRCSIQENCRRVPSRARLPSVDGTRSVCSAPNRLATDRYRNFGQGMCELRWSGRERFGH
jgi:hypothetical protein